MRKSCIQISTLGVNMSNGDDIDTLSKFSRLKRHSDFIQWRSKMKAYVRRNDPTLIGLFEKPRGRQSDAFVVDWTNHSAKAKGRIILFLSDSVAERARDFVDDDDKTAKELWEELQRLFTTSSAQFVQNIKNKLGTLIFRDGSSYEKHLATFMTVIGELASY